MESQTYWEVRLVGYILCQEYADNWQEPPEFIVLNLLLLCDSIDSYTVGLN